MNFIALGYLIIAGTFSAFGALLIKYVAVLNPKNLLMHHGIPQLCLFLGILSYGVSFIFLYNALAITLLSIAYPIFLLTSTLIVVVLSKLALGESLDKTSIFGISTGLVGAICLFID